MYRSCIGTSVGIKKCHFGTRLLEWNRVKLKLLRASAPRQTSLVTTRIYWQAREAELCTGILFWLSMCYGLFSRMRWWRLNLCRRLFFREGGWSWPGWAAEGDFTNTLRQSLPWLMHWGMKNSGSRTAVLWTGDSGLHCSQISWKVLKTQTWSPRDAEESSFLSSMVGSIY